MIAEFAVMIVVFGSLVLVVDQVRRMVGHVVLNRTLREALRHHPESVPLLVAKIEPPRPWSINVGGWIFLAAGVAIGGLALAYGSDAGEEALPIGVGFGLVGIAMLAWSRFNARRTDRLM